MLVVHSNIIIGLTLCFLFRFGELVSTSNSFSLESKEVFVETDSLLLWTMDMPEDLLGEELKCPN